MPEVEVCTLAELPPGTVRVLHGVGPEGVGVYNCGGELFAIEDRCTHDDGKLCEGEWEPETLRGDLPTPRRTLRRAHRAGADAAGLPAGGHLPGARA